MADDEIIDEEEVAAGDGTVLEPGPLLDIGKLSAEADRRYDKAKANPNRRGDPDKAYMGYVVGLLNESEQALSEALRGAAEAWVAKSDEAGIGETARKHLLAAKVLAGDFDK